MIGASRQEGSFPIGLLIVGTIVVIALVIAIAMRRNPSSGASVARMETRLSQDGAQRHDTPTVDVPPPPPPLSRIPAPPPVLAEERLRRLDQLFQQGAVTAEEYALQRKRVLDSL